jgi:hypothetical protein
MFLKVYKMRKIIKYFVELLETLKSIDKRLETLESCTRYDSCSSSPRPGKVLKTQSGYP